MTEYALGCDISHWQQTVDFEKMYGAGARFVFLKASQAVWTDKRFVENYEKARKTKLLVGMYHYLDWTKSGVEQAQYFAALVNSYPPDLPPVLDYECRKNAPDPSQALHQALKFLQEVKRLTNRDPMLYTSRGYWNEFGSSDKYWTSIPLWFALYPTVSIDLDQIKLPAPWQKLEFWQFTDRGDGSMYGVQSKQIDLNYFNGSEEDLLAKYAAQTPPQQPPQPPPQAPDTVIRLVALQNVNIREMPTVTSLKVGMLKAGEQIVVNNIFVESASRIWVRHSAGWSALVYDGNILIKEVKP